MVSAGVICLCLKFMRLLYQDTLSNVLYTWIRHRFFRDLRWSLIVWFCSSKNHVRFVISKVSSLFNSSRRNRHFFNLMVRTKALVSWPGWWMGMRVQSTSRPWQGNHLRRGSLGNDAWPSNGPAVSKETCWSRGRPRLAAADLDSLLT